jgi:hypothetical protein
MDFWAPKRRHASDLEALSRSIPTAGVRLAAPHRKGFVLNPTIAQFFKNYHLLPDFDAFAAAQSAVMHPDVRIVARDHRDWQESEGVAAYVDSVRDWSRHYDNSSDRSLKQVSDDGTNVEVRVLGTIVFRTPQAGVSHIPEADHDWREWFVLRDGRIATARIDMGIYSQAG